MTVKGFSKRTYIHRRFPSLHPELLFGSSSQSLEGLAFPGPGGTPAHSGCPGPSPGPGTLPPSFLGPSCCGPWGGGWTLPERGSGKGTLEGPWDAEPLWPGTAVLTSTRARQGHLALLCLTCHAGQGPQPVSHQAAQSHGHPHPVVTLLVPDWGAGPRASFPVSEGWLDSQGLWGSGCLRAQMAAFGRMWPSPRGPAL